MRELLIEKFEKPDEVLVNNVMIWRNEEGRSHRNGDKPAKIWKNGSREWWINGKFHRCGDKPAGIYYTTSCSRACDFEIWWAKNDVRHRGNNKPAVIYSDGLKEWWINGKLVKKNY